MTDAYKPMIYYSTDNAFTGNYSLILNKRCLYAMPYVENPRRCYLEFRLKQPQEKYLLQIGVMTDLNDESTFVPYWTLSNKNYNISTDDFGYFRMRFHKYNVKGHYIAFRNILADGYTGDYSVNYLDNIYLYDVGCIDIDSIYLPYNDNFDQYTTSTTAKTGEEPFCWQLAGSDVTMTDEYKPMIYYSPTNAHSGNYSLILNKRGIYAMPHYSQDVRNLQLDFYLKQTQAKYQLEVGVIHNSSFYVASTINNPTTDYEHVTVNFSSLFDNYTNGFIAFRNILAPGQTGDYSINYIDDLVLDLRPVVTCTGINVADLPYTDNFDSYTSSTTAKTGVEPDCWTLAHQFVTMTDEYKPMIYYSSANAHSGNYSLLLNKRGIYTMPEFNGDVNTLQMSFYLKQTQAKYQLQVGVMSDLSNASSFVPVATFNNSSTTASVLCNVDFSSYTGSGHYIAFRNILASGQTGDYSCNYIDDITLELRPVATCTGINVADLPYTDNFDSYTTSTTAKTGVQPNCWTLAHQDVVMADEYKPMIYYASANAHSGNYSLILNKRGIYAMPEFNGDLNTLQLSFYLKQTQAKYQLQVGIMTSLTNPDSFTPVRTINNSTTGIEQVTVNFSAYTGTGRYIVFRNILASGQTGDYSINYIDDLTLELIPESCTGINVTDLPYTDNFDSYTTSTTAKTGVQPDCWTLAHQYVTMTDEYKPMVYYASANAHSGNYSLILNKRGIYAMPEFNGDVNTLQLSFYLKQPQTKYQLQVGVMNNLNNADSFSPVTIVNNSSTNIEHVTVDFSAYTGTGHYIAFRNILASGQTGDYSINYIDDLTLELRPSGCSAINVADLPFSDNFDSYTSSTTAKTGIEPDCWTLAKQDVTITDEYKPMIYYASANAHSGNYSLILNKRGIYAMPEFNGDVNTLQLSFYLKQSQAKYQLQVGVLNSLNNPDSFTPVTTVNNSSTNIEHVTVDFSAYTGSGRFIAFRNVLASGQTGDYSLNYIDDLRLEARCAIYPDELPFTDNFDSYTSSTTAKTGVQPDCWTLAHQDVTMTDEYKPMVYYASANAHSGNYSLILNKRGIYAMPRYSGNVNSLQLSFYLKQTQAKYQLQVGVMTDINNASTFTPVATFNNTSTTSHVLRTVNFSSYTGSGHYIAFRNILASGQTGDYSLNYIDDLTLSSASKGNLDEEPSTTDSRHLTLYPNPTTGRLTVEADEEVIRVDVFDYTGRNVATFQGQTTLDLSRLASGLYTLRVTLPERIEVRRVVKQ